MTGGDRLAVCLRTIPLGVLVQLNASVWPSGESGIQAPELAQPARRAKTRRCCWRHRWQCGNHITDGTVGGKWQRNRRRSCLRSKPSWRPGRLRLRRNCREGHRKGWRRTACGRTGWGRCSGYRGFRECARHRLAEDGIILNLVGAGIDVASIVGCDVIALKIDRQTSVAEN